MGLLDLLVRLIRFPEGKRRGRKSELRLALQLALALGLDLDGERDLDDEEELDESFQDHCCNEFLVFF